MKGTAGDTGSASIRAVRGMKWVDIIVLLPKGRCNEIQELQMTTVLDENVHNFGGIKNNLIGICIALHFSICV